MQTFLSEIFAEIDIMQKLGNLKNGIKLVQFYGLTFNFESKAEL